MWISRFALIVITAVIMSTLLIIKVDPIFAALLTILIIMMGYILISLNRNKKRLSLLDTACDPEAFMESTKKQRIIMAKNMKYTSYLDIDLAAGLITLGRFQEAKEILLSIDKGHLSPKNDTLLVHTINLMLCYYGLGEIEAAEELFETQLPLLAPINPRIVIAVKVLMAERFFCLKRYAESKEQFEKMLGQKLSKRTELEVLYGLALIDEVFGDEEAAILKYRQVAGEGYKLWIADKAREKCT